MTLQKAFLLGWTKDTFVCLGLAQAKLSRKTSWSVERVKDKSPEDVESVNTMNCQLHPCLVSKGKIWLLARRRHHSSKSLSLLPVTKRLSLWLLVCSPTVLNILLSRKSLGQANQVKYPKQMWRACKEKWALEFPGSIKEFKIKTWGGEIWN